MVPLLLEGVHDREERSVDLWSLREGSLDSLEVADRSLENSRRCLRYGHKAVLVLSPPRVLAHALGLPHRAAEQMDGIPAFVVFVVVFVCVAFDLLPVGPKSKREKGELGENRRPESGEMENEREKMCAGNPMNQRRA